MGLVKKWAANNIVTIFTGLPNLAINFGIQSIFDIGLHWSGFYALLAYVIGTGCSVQYSVMFSMLTRSNFTILGHTWHFSHKPKPDKNQAPKDPDSV